MPSDLAAGVVINKISISYQGNSNIDLPRNIRSQHFVFYYTKHSTAINNILK